MWHTFSEFSVCAHWHRCGSLRIRKSNLPALHFTYLMPRCPSCGKSGFSNHEAVARHMSQPRSGCSSWSDNLIRLQEELLPTGSHDTQQAMVVDADSQGISGAQEFQDEEGSFENVHDDENLRVTTALSIHHYPGAARSFEGGTTFLDKFDEDRFSSHRESNIYYPYAFRGEWEMASWLLRSGLSMSAIDSFLSLDLVRVFVALYQIHC